MKTTKRTWMIGGGLFGLLCLICLTFIGCQSFLYMASECAPDWVRVRQNKARAERFLRAAEQGDAEAQREIGTCYFLGLGIPRDREEAVRWFHKAAEQGHANANCRLAFCYYHGEGVPQDKAEAIRRFHTAAELGNTEAQWKLGACYLNGIEVPQDEAEAAGWFRKAAEQDYYYAQYLLGRCYFEGTGVPKDDAEATKWLRKTSWLKEAAALLREIESDNPRAPNPQWGKALRDSL